MYVFLRAKITLFYLQVRALAPGLFSLVAMLMTVCGQTLNALKAVPDLKYQCLPYGTCSFSRMKESSSALSFFGVE